DAVVARCVSRVDDIGSAETVECRSGGKGEAHARRVSSVRKDDTLADVLCIAVAVQILHAIDDVIDLVAHDRHTAAADPEARRVRWRKRPGRVGAIEPDVDLAWLVDEYIVIGVKESLNGVVGAIVHEKMGLAEDRNREQKYNHKARNPARHAGTLRLRSRI